MFLEGERERTLTLNRKMKASPPPPPPSLLKKHSLPSLPPLSLGPEILGAPSQIPTRPNKEFASSRTFLYCTCGPPALFLSPLCSKTASANSGKTRNSTWRKFSPEAQTDSSSAQTMAGEREREEQINKIRREAKEPLHNLGEREHYWLECVCRGAGLYLCAARTSENLHSLSNKTHGSFLSLFCCLIAAILQLI